MGSNQLHPYDCAYLVASTLIACMYCDTAYSADPYETKMRNKNKKKLIEKIRDRKKNDIIGPLTR